MGFRDVTEVVQKAEKAVIEALKEHGLPENWYDNRDAVLRIRMIIAAAAPVIEEGVLNWVEHELLPLALADEKIRIEEGE